MAIKKTTVKSRVTEPDEMQLIQTALDKIESDIDDLYTASLLEHNDDAAKAHFTIQRSLLGIREILREF